MNATARRWMAAWACAAAASMAAVAFAAEPQAPAATAESCTLPEPDPDAHPLSRRDETIARYRQMPERCLKAMVVACNAAAGRVLLDLGSAVQCSFGYEALLAQGFRGDFHALMAWWRSEGRPPP